MASRLPDVDFSQLENTVRSMAKTGELLALGDRKYRRYNLPYFFSLKKWQKKLFFIIRNGILKI